MDRMKMGGYNFTGEISFEQQQCKKEAIEKGKT